MNDLIPIVDRQIGGVEVMTVDGRALHAFLEVGRDFTTWIKDRISQYGFTAGTDFAVAEILSTPDSGSAMARAQRAVAYHLSVDMAKELAMVERNDKGKEARKYFIECERRAKQLATPKSLPEALRLAAAEIEKREAAEAALAIAAPKAQALDLISAGADAMTITQAAKKLSIKRDTLTTWLHANGWAYRQNGSWVAYDQHIKNGRLQYKEARYTDQHTSQDCRRSYFHITPKGMALLAVVFAARQMEAA